MRFEVFWLLFICLLLLASCMSTPTITFFSSPTSPTQVQTPEAKIIIMDPPIPETGKASVSGLLYSFTGKGPIPGTLFYLTPVGEQSNPPNILVGPCEERGDIRGISDDKGQIILNNIPPGKYYLVVWAPYNWILAVESEEDLTPRLIILRPNQRLNLGVIYLPWP